MEKVLIVDDEVDICFLLSAILKKRGLSSITANYLAEGKNFINKVRPEILFLDINLPDGSGLDIIKETKELIPEIKIIVISAYDNEREHAFQKGADSFINKPFSKERVYEALEKLQLLPAEVK